MARFWPRPAQTAAARQSAVEHVITSLARISLLVQLLALFSWLITPTQAYTALSDHFLKLVPSGGDDFDIDNGKLLAPILIPRVPGTPGQVVAQEHFVNFFRNELPKWSIEWFNSTGKTPVTGDRDIPFQNLLFKREPPWVRQGQSNLLTLVAHYDSKITPEGFIGATDSAVPCAILMHVARTIDRYVTQMHDEMDALGEGGTVPMDMGVQILLLDGEEAFLNWSPTDSLYGARYALRCLQFSFHLQSLNIILWLRDTKLRLLTMSTELWRNTGKLLITQLTPATRTRWIKSACSCSWTFSGPPTLPCRPLSCPRTGRTRPWLRSSSACAH